MRPTEHPRRLALLSLVLAACGAGKAGAPPPPPPSDPVLEVGRMGPGEVASTPPGIACGAACSARFAPGAAVTLSATPAAGHRFTGWGGACSGTGPCAVTMSEARLVTATFLPEAGAGAQACTVTRSTATTPAFAAAHPRVLFNHGETAACLRGLLAGEAAPAVRYRDMVDAQLAGADIYAFSPADAAFLYQVTGEAAYAEYAVAMAEARVASEEALVATGQRPEVAFDSYLYVSEHVGDLMLVYDWCHPFLTAAQRTRWLDYANQAVWNVWHPEQATWGGRAFPWSGWSIDNPSNNYFYSFNRATMLLGLASRGDDPRAQGWLDQFRTAKLEAQLFPTFTRDLEGGGSREGTGYGTAMRTLFGLYDWWERSTGERIATRTPHTLASMAHLLHDVMPTLDRLAPTGDHARDSTAALFDYHREYLLELMTLFPDERLSGVAATLLASSSVPRMANRFMFGADYLYAPPALQPRPLSELSTTYWAPGTGQLLMRSGWDTAATFAGLVCGPYTESHAHRDQGSFVLFKGGWLAWDANLASHSGIEQGEEMHNLVRLEQGGATVTQVEGAGACRLTALSDGPRVTVARADVTPVYAGKAAAVRVERELVFVKPATLVVFDRVETAAGVRRVWTLNLPSAPTVTGDRIAWGDAAGRLDVVRLSPAGLASQVVAGARIEAADAAGTQTRFLHVLGAGGAVAGAVRSDAAGQTGALVTLADGRTALVRFPDAGAGGSYELRDAGGALLEGGPLPTSVTAPPLFVE